VEHTPAICWIHQQKQGLAATNSIKLQTLQMQLQGAYIQRYSTCNSTILTILYSKKCI